MVIIALATVIPVCASADSDADLKLGRQFLYCGALTVKLIEFNGKMNGNLDVAARQSKNANGKMIIQTAALIPEEQLDSEYKAAQDYLAERMKMKAIEDASAPGAMGAFLEAEYEKCQKLQTEKGLEVFQRGVQSMASPKNKAPE